MYYPLYNNLFIVNKQNFVSHSIPRLVDQVWRWLQNKMGTEGKLHPYYRASLISRITLWWIFGILRTGYGRPLQHDDLYPVRDEEQAERLTRRLIRKWNEEKKIAKAVKKRPLLWKALLRFFTWSDYAYIVVVGIVEAMAYNLAWCCTIMLIDVFGYGTNLSSSEFSGLVLTYGLALSQLVNLIAGQHFQLHSVFLGIRARAAALGLLYREVSCLNAWKSYSIFILICRSFIHSYKILKIKLKPNKYIISYYYTWSYLTLL